MTVPDTRIIGQLVDDDIPLMQELFTLCVGSGTIGISRYIEPSPERRRIAVLKVNWYGTWIPVCYAEEAPPTPTNQTVKQDLGWG